METVLKYEYFNNGTNVSILSVIYFLRREPFVFYLKTLITLKASKRKTII